MSDGTITIDVTLAKEKLLKELKNMKSTINSILPNASSMLSSFASEFSKLGGLATSAGKTCSIAIAGIVAGLSSAIGRFDTLNNYPKVLSNLGFSAEEAKESVDELSKGIDGLPTALDDAASGVQRLVAKNGDIKKSTKYFLAMNDAIVAGNAPAQQQTSAIEQLTQAYSKGKPDVMEWRTLMMAMPGQLKQIATAMGYIDTDALYEALKEGTISIDEFMDAIVELDQNGADGILSFQEQAKNSCDSIGTAMTNVSNRFKKGFATILSSMNEVAKGTAFGSIAGMINNLSSSIKNFLDKIGETLKGNEVFKTFINQMSSGLIQFNNKINGLSAEQLDKIVTALVNIVKAGPALLVVGKGFNVISSGFNGLSSGVKIIESLEGKVLGLPKSFLSISNIFSNMGTLIKSGLDKGIITTSLFAKLVKFNVGESFNQAFPSVSSGISKVSEAISGGLANISNFFAPASNVFSIFTEKIKGILSPITSTFSKITGTIGKSFSGITKIVKKILPTFLKGFNITAIIGLVVAGLGLLQGQFGEQIEQIAQMMTEQGPTIISNLVNGIVSALPQLIAQGSRLIQTLLNVIITNLPSVIQGGIEIISALVIGVAQQLPTLVPMALEMILTIVMSLLDNIDQLIDAGIELIIGLADGLINAIPMLIEKAPIIIEKLLTALINNAPKLVKSGWELIIKLITGIIEQFPALAEAAGKIIEEIWNVLKELPQKAMQWGKDMIQGFIDGIKSMLGAVGDAVKGVGDKVKSFLHFSRPDEGPLRNYETWMPDMIDGLTRTLKQSAPELYNASELLAEKLSNSLDLSNIYNKMKNVVELETGRISTNLSTTALSSTSFTANINVTGNTYMDSEKVGKMTAPTVAKTFRGGGAYAN